MSGSFTQKVWSDQLDIASIKADKGQVHERANVALAKLEEFCVPDALKASGSFMDANSEYARRRIK
jgi:hypothetical protein